MEIVDAQVHANHRGLDQSIAIMDAVGVNAAVIDVWPPVRTKTADGVMRFEYPFAEEAVERFPQRFAYVARFDPNDPELDNLMADLRRKPGRLCVRIASGFDFKLLQQGGGHEKILAAAGRHRVPIMIYPGDYHATLQKYVKGFPDTQFIIDHVGMGVDRPSLPSQLEQTIDQLISYAKYPHVAVKWGHAPRLSREAFPYRDLLQQLGRVIEAFGAKRIMWASDYTVTTDHHTYAESLFCIRCADQLSAPDKEWLLGRSARAILGWMG
ncbi:MAG TPA: amidohydrolase family protein [Candidatus Binataceae bacterium]|jgi:predicted TIM-barrel fold metal-dependent hydrolase|nr:amidohydrolase family protein [Candidatus Binataceae bacterium]